MNATRRVVGTLLLALLFGALAPTQGLAQDARPPPADDAISSLADCVATSDRVLALFLIDESGSLKRTDVENRRVDALKAALAGLEQVRKSSAARGGGIGFEVQLGGFSVGFNPLTDWMPLDEASAADLSARSEAFAAKNRGIDTDYTAALIGAQEAFAVRAAALSSGGVGSVCKAVFWFTDGEFDIEPRSTGETKAYAPDIAITGPEAAARLEERGRSLLCDEDGIVDHLRRDRIALVTFGLAASIEAPDEAFLKAMAEGSAEGGERCGRVPIPADWTAGAYVRAEEVTDLIARFYGVVVDILEGTQVADEELPVCPRQECPQGTKSFVIDPGISSFNLLGLTGTAGIDVELRSPETPGPLVVPAGQSGAGTLGSADIRYTWIAGDGLVVEAALPAEEGPWHGEWSVTFIDRSGQNPGAVARAQIYLFGGLVPVLEPDLAFRAGEGTDFVVTVAHEEGTPADEGVFKQVGVTARVVNPEDGASELIDLSGAESGRHVGTWSAPATDFPSMVNVSVQLDVVTASGLALRPVTRTFAVPVQPPNSYPSISPSDLRLSPVTGTDNARGTLIITGGDTSGGCVWIGNGSFPDAPTEAGEIAVRTVPAVASATECLAVGPGEVIEVEVIAEAAEAANGTAHGSLTVHLVSDANPDALTLTLPIGFDMVRPINEAERLLIFAALMLGGLLLPLLLLLIVNWATGRFEPPSGYREAAVPVLITAAGGLLRRGTDMPAAPLRFESDDFINIGGDAGRRRSFVTPAGVRFGSRSFRIFRSPQGEATSAGRLIASNTGRGTSAEGAAAPVPFGLAGTWVLVVDEPIAPVEPAKSASDDPGGDVVGRLIAYAPVGRVADQTVHLNGDLQHALPPVAELLREISERTTPVSVAAPASDDGVEAPTSSLGGLNPHLGAKPPASSLGGAPRLKTPVPATSPPPRPPEPAGARPASSPIDSPPRPDRPPPSSLGGKPPRSSLDGDPPGSS